MKKCLVLTLALAVFVWVAFQIDSQKIFTAENCPFCDRSIIERQAVYRENGCIALLDYKPDIKGHVLIIPERHVERFEDLTADELIAMHKMIAKVDRAERSIFGSTGYVLVQKNGIEAGQSVPHVHFHYLKMSHGDSKIWPAIRMFISGWFKPLSAEELNQQRLEFNRNGLAD
jgi:histidine triad (HIT) family protein